MDTNIEDIACASLRNIRYSDAVKKVQSHMKEKASGIMMTRLEPDDISMYNELEERKISETLEALWNLIEEEIYPAIFSYVSSNHPELVGDFFEEDGSDLFDSLKLRIYNTPLREDFRRTGERIAGERLASFVFDEETQERLVEVFLDEVFHDFPYSETTEENFSDFLFQILLHELLHAVSSDISLTKEEEEAERARLSLRESVTGSVPMDRSNLAFNVGYVFNFINAGENSADLPFLAHPAVRLANEALTDTIAARIYSEYSRRKYGKARKYLFSYRNEARIFQRGFAEFARDSGLDKRKAFREIEAGFFFPGQILIDAMNRYLLPMMDYCPELHAKAPSAGIILPGDREDPPSTKEIVLPPFRSSKRVS